MIVAHIAGIPVEETVLALAPVGLVGFGVLFSDLLQRVRRRNR
jgi:hypothetical protein